MTTRALLALGRREAVPDVRRLEPREGNQSPIHVFLPRVRVHPDIRLDEAIVKCYILRVLESPISVNQAQGCSDREIVPGRAH